MSRVSGVLGELLWVGGGQAVAVAGSLVGVRLLTHYLPPQIYGEMALALTGGMLLQNIFTGPCCNAIQRFYAPAKDERRIGAYLVAGRRLFLEAVGASLASTLVVVLALGAAGQFRWIPLVSVASLLALVSGCGSFLDTLQNAARHRKVVAWHQGLGQWARFLLVIGVVQLFGTSSFSALAGTCAGAAIVLLSQAFFLRRFVVAECAATPLGAPANNHQLVAEMRRYAWPFLAWGVFGWIQSSADRWALGVGATAEDVGLFAVLAQLGLGPITLLTGIVLQLISPILYDRAGAGTDETRVARAININHRLFLATLALTLAAVVVMWFLHAMIFRWLTAPVYWKVSHLLPWISLGGGLFAAAQVLSLSLLCKFDSKVLLWPKICTALLATGLYFAVAPHYGIDGVVYVGLLASATYVAWVYYLTAKRAPRRADDQIGPHSDQILYAK